uniref:Uncharacterized protein n=1 Tax=Candidatus Kentrum sp. LPFa TaxID=2126335 RepID=A0A450WDQ3_9GAMM|nr:MAG: hypothetical protein BECKLPF1236B_GA0070989_107311 [Candidatus Kentron sp. LPFa]
MKVAPRKSQSGAASILVLGIIVLVWVGIFLGRPGRGLPPQLRYAEQTALALAEAKQALIGWAVSHPNAPGSLPWPDRNADGNYDGDSDCASLWSGATFNPAFLLGRLPWRGRTNPCERVHGGLGVDIRDGAGERLWYGVSRNLIRRYQSPAGYPLINAELANSAPFPWFTVRDAGNNLISDRVAVVLLAPGVALNGQDRSGVAPNAKNYLDIHGQTGIDNADSDNCFDDNAGCGGVDGEEFVLADMDSAFNDRLVFITTDELVAKVERRVLNEADKVLDGYRKTMGVYPWMSPFAYPPAMVSGSATGNGDTALDPVDANGDFIAAGVRPGQVIRNVTDGSKGIIATVSSRDRLSLTAEGLRQGDDNRFSINRMDDPDDNDRYEILVDTSGIATDGSLGNRLEDTARAVDFATLGIRPGDVVENVSDGTHGVVVGILDSKSLSLRRLASDGNMAFDPGDSYEIPRFNGVPGMREGALPLHGAGERFRTGFTVAWNISGGTFEITPSTNNSEYLRALREALGCSGLDDLATPGAGSSDCNPNLPSVTAPWSDGSCSWRAMDSVRCQGRADWRWRLAGTVTGNHASSATGFKDHDADFHGMGVDEGDIVLDVTDGSRGVISSVANQELEAIRLDGGTRNDFQVGDQYRIRVATSILPEKSANCADISHDGHTITCGPLTLVDTDRNFRQLGVRAGDSIENRTKGCWGIIRESSASANTESVLRVVSMGGGSANDFSHGDRYIIRTGFVDKRRHAFALAFHGSATVHENTGQRAVRTRIGAPLAAQNEIQIQDWDATGQRIVVDAAIRTGPVIATDTWFDVSGIRLDLAPDDFPDWFFDNDWHKFIYMAASPAYLPGGNGDCALSGNCLTLKTVGLGGTTVRADVEALLISAGSRTDGANCPQNRPAANPNRYFEGENAPSANDATFERRHERRSDTCFRDQVKVVAP